MRRRLPFALAVTLAVAGAAVAIVLLVRDERAVPAGLPVGDDGMAARTSVRPRSQHFGDPLVARLDLLIDREVLDPEKVVVLARFDPFTPAGETRRTQTDYDRFTRLRFEFSLECLGANCVPDTLTKDFDFAPTIVRHRGDQVGIVRWPSVTIASRVGEFESDVDNPAFQPAEVPWRATLRLRPPTYSVDPTLLTSLFAAFALVLLGVSLYFVQIAFPSAPLGFRRLRRVKLTPLERALAVLERAHVRGIEREQRLALDRLAHELRSGGERELAGTARELAWEQTVPGPERTSQLSDRVRELIAGRTNGRS